MEAFVFIPQIFFTTHAVLKIGYRHSDILWGIFSHMIRLDQWRTSENV